MNKNIIDEFNKLLAFIQEDIDKLIIEKNIKSITINKFRLKQIKNILNILKNYPIKITIHNYIDLKNIDGIGKGTIDRIKEILETGKLSELENFSNNKVNKKKIIQDLESVIGIGHTHAIELYNQGITSVRELKKKIKEGIIHVNDKIKLGLKYYGKFKEHIPREETQQIYNIFKNIFKNLNKNLKLNEQYIFEFCGSYRREKLVSGDIDILISKKGKLKEDTYLHDIIKILKNPIKENNNKPLLIDDLTELGKTKYMGFGKYLLNPVRRIDIRFIPYESYFSALLYFTGSAELNKKMRQIAKNKNLKLSEYGLFKNNKQIPINSEKDIFDILEIEYLVPKLR